MPNNFNKCKYFVGLMRYYLRDQITIYDYLPPSSEDLYTANVSIILFTDAGLRGVLAILLVVLEVSKMK